MVNYGKLLRPSSPLRNVVDYSISHVFPSFFSVKTAVFTLQYCYVREKMPNIQYYT